MLCLPFVTAQFKCFFDCGRAVLSFAIALFKRFFDSGRAIRCLLPFAIGRFMHLVVLYGYQGADSDAEQLALTNSCLMLPWVSWV